MKTTEQQQNDVTELQKQVDLAQAVFDLINRLFWPFRL